MKTVFTSVLLVMALGLTFGQAQEKKTEGYVINGYLTGNYQGNGKVYLVEEEDIQGKQHVIDSCEVVNNRYTFKGPKKEVVKMYFIKSTDTISTNLLTPVFLEEGVIQVKGDAKYFLQAEVRGTVNNDILNFYFFQNRYVTDSMMRSTQLEWATVGQGDAEHANAEFKRRTKSLENRWLAIQRGLVTRFKDQPFAPFMIYWEMKANVSLNDLKSLRALVDPKLNDHPYTRQLDYYIQMADFKVGSVMADFTLPDQNGKEISLKDYKGKYVLVDFWASWCGPCMRELPNVVKLYKECKGKNFEILGISLDSKKDAWLEAIKKNNMTWPQLCDFEMWNMDPVKACNVQGIPFTVLLDPQGNVIGLNLRGEELISKVKEVLRGK